MMLAVAAILAPASLWAQDVPAAEFFGGFSVLSAGGGGERDNVTGWQAAISGNLSNRFSIVGDFGGHYQDGGSAHEILGGVRLNHRLEKATIFGHALPVGITKFSDGGGSEFTMGFGGGVDVNAGSKIAIRIVQFDWMPIKFDSGWEKNNVRFGFGIVFKSGMR